MDAKRTEAPPVELTPASAPTGTGPVRADPHASPKSSLQQGSDRPARTHCLRGHEFTPENTQWINVNVPILDASGTKRVQRSRLCRICSRARVRRYSAKKSPKPARSQPLPPLPEDLYELELERTIRRILRARLHRRAPDFWQEVESRLEHHAFRVDTAPRRVPIRRLALHKESWSAYAVRTHAKEDDHGDWFVNRMLDDPRIRAMLGMPGQSTSSLNRPTMRRMPLALALSAAGGSLCPLIPAPCGNFRRCAPRAGAEPPRSRETREDAGLTAKYQPPRARPVARSGAGPSPLRPSRLACDSAPPFWSSPQALPR